MPVTPVVVLANMLMAETPLSVAQGVDSNLHLHLMERDPKLAASWDELWEACELQRYGATDANTSDMAQRVLALAQTTEASWS